MPAPSDAQTVMDARPFQDLLFETMEDATRAMLEFAAFHGYVLQQVCEVDVGRPGHRVVWNCAVTGCPFRLIVRRHRQQPTAWFIARVCGRHGGHDWDTTAGRHVPGAGPGAGPGSGSGASAGAETSAMGAANADVEATEAADAGATGAGAETTAAGAETTAAAGARITAADAGAAGNTEAAVAPQAAAAPAAAVAPALAEAGTTGATTGATDGTTAGTTGATTGTTSSTTTHALTPPPLAPVYAATWSLARHKSIWQGPPQNVPADGHCGYRALLLACSSSSSMPTDADVLQLRQRYWTWLDEVAPVQMPWLRASTWEAAKRRAVAQALAPAETDITPLAPAQSATTPLTPAAHDQWLSSQDLPWLAQMLQVVIVVCDLEYPSEWWTSVPFSGAGEAIPPVVGLVYDYRARHWQAVRIRCREALPHVCPCTLAWGMEKWQLVQSDFHRRLHQGYRFMVRKVLAEDGGCGCV